MAWAVFRRHFVIGTGALVGVADEDGDGAAEGEAVLQAGEDFSGIRFFARGDDFRLARAAAVEFVLDLAKGKRNSGWAAVDDDTDTATV